MAEGGIPDTCPTGPQHHLVKSLHRAGVFPFDHDRNYPQLQRLQSNNKNREEKPKFSTMPESPAPALHESETVEFKESFDREVVVSAGALANTRGGTIFIGITDRGNVVGTLIGTESFKEWANTISQSTEPPPDPGCRVRPGQREDHQFRIPGSGIDREASGYERPRGSRAARDNLPRRYDWQRYPLHSQRGAKGAKGAVKGRDWGTSDILPSGAMGQTDFMRCPGGRGYPHELLKSEMIHKLKLNNPLILRV